MKLILGCDALPYGVVAVISHEMDDGKDRPIAFASRTLTESERTYTQKGSHRNHCMVAALGCSVGLLFCRLTTISCSTVHLLIMPVLTHCHVFPMTRNPSRKRPNCSSSQAWINHLLMHPISAEASQEIRCYQEFGVYPLRMARLWS